MTPGCIETLARAIRDHKGDISARWLLRVGGGTPLETATQSQEILSEVSSLVAELSQALLDDIGPRGDASGPDSPATRFLVDDLWEFCRGAFAREPVDFCDLEARLDRAISSVGGRLPAALEGYDLDRDLELDTRTGLPNFRSVRHRLAREIERASAADDVVSIELLVVDFFREFDNCFGCSASEGMLRAIGGIIQDSLRDRDMVGRYGPGEFALVLPHTSKGSAYRAADRLHQNVRETTERDINFPRVLTLSYGIASYPEDGLTAEQLLRLADRALSASHVRWAQGEAAHF